MFVVFCFAVPALGVVPHWISYQGVLTDGAGTPVPDGTYSITFSLFTQPEGGSEIWSTTMPVVVSGGIFNVALGEFGAEHFEHPSWLGISVDGGQEMTPRRELLSAPYAMNSLTVQDGAIHALKIANGTAVRSLNSLTDDVTLVGGTNISVDPIGSNIIISAVGSGGIGGSGSAGQVAFWSDPSTLSGENNLFWDSTNKRLGIGTPNPNGRLRVESSEQYTAVFSGNYQSNNTQVIRANFVGTGTGYDPTAVFGRARPAEGYGYGGSFEGGKVGLYAFGNGGAANTEITGLSGEATGTGSGHRYGVVGRSSGPNGDNVVGVAGFASGVSSQFSLGVMGRADNGPFARYGVYGQADGPSSYYYGIYGYTQIAQSAAAMYANGDIVYTGSLIGPVSDMDAKRNAQPFDGVLPRIMQIEPRTFEYKTDDPYYTGVNLSPGRHFGVMAQDLEAIFPELVLTRTYPRSGPFDEQEVKPPLELKSVNYIELVPILVQAIKEQQQTIESLSARVAQLESR
jgi:hypothetical protein